MRTMFQLGLQNDVFWMGQPLPTPGTTINREDTCAKLTAAENQFGLASGLVNSNPNYRQLLGADAMNFDKMLKDMNEIYNDVLNTEGILCGGGGIERMTQDQLINVQSFIAVSTELGKIVQAHKTAAPTVVKPGAKPTAVQVVSPGPNPLLIGGVAVVAGVALLALVLR